MSDVYVEDKNLVNETTYEYAEQINEHVDYAVQVLIRHFDDNSKAYEVLNETLNVFDETGTICESFLVKLPSKYVEQALKDAEEYGC